MIDLDLAGIATDDLAALHAAAHATPDVWHAQLRATGRVVCDWVDTITVAGSGVTVKANDDIYLLGEGEELHMTPQTAAIFTPTVWDVGVIKRAEDRYTLSAWYIPNQTDAHGEWTDADTLQKAAWGYVESGDRRIRLQHDTTVVAGEWVEAVTWPFEVSLPMTMADGSRQVQTFPPNTVFLGVVWEPWAWSRVVSGEINGFSIGGQADRVVVGD